MKRTVLISILFILVPFFAMAMEPDPGCGDTNVNGEETPDIEKDSVDYGHTPVASMTDDGVMYDCTDPDNKDLPVCQSIEKNDSMSDTPFIGASGCRVTLDYCRDPYHSRVPSCSYTGGCSDYKYKSYCLDLIIDTCGGVSLAKIYLRNYDIYW